MAADRWVSVKDAAEILGINERTVRKWIADGRLEKRPGDRGYQVLVSDQAAAAEADEQPETVPTPAAAHRRSRPGDIDLEPIAELVTSLTKRNEELAAAAAMWQERARVLEERNRELLALEPGPIVEATPARPWWRRMLGLG
jgi:excisionase family DNA binding protein